MSTAKLILISYFLSAAFSFTFAQEAHIEIKKDRNKIVIKNRNGLSNFDVEMRGKIELTDDDKDIKSMSSDGYLEINKTVFGSRRTLIISPQDNGLRKDYYEGRTKVPFDPAGKEWLGEILPELVRSTTIGADSRVDRFFKNGGPPAVVAEIERLESNYVKSHYANLLMKRPVNSRDYAKIIDRIARTLDSNYYLSGFLTNNMDNFLNSSDALEAVFRATNNMDSDHYRTLVIKAGLSAQSVSLEAVRVILKSAGNMDSDHYKTEVLTSLLRQDNLNDDIVSEMIITSKTIDSDYYRSVVLNSALKQEGLSNKSFQRALESVKDIDSDHYKSEVLTSLLSKPISQDLQITLVELTHSIDSDHYCSSVLEQILERQEITDPVFAELIQRAASIDSDHYASMVMKDALDKHLNDANLVSLLNSVARISSDHYLSEVLMVAAPKVRGRGESVREAFNSAARQINSETYYGRVMRALNNN